MYLAGQAFEAFHAHFAFPDDEYPPSKQGKLLLVRFVPCDVSSKFFSPIAPVAPRNPKVLTPRVLVPKTALHEDHSFVLWKGYIGLSG